MDCDFSSFRGSQESAIYRDSEFVHEAIRRIQKLNVAANLKWVACFLLDDSTDKIILYCKDMNSGSSAQDTPSIGSYIFGKRIFEISQNDLNAEEVKNSLMGINEFIDAVKVASNRRGGS